MYAKYFKRPADLTLALALLIILFPLIVIVALAIKIESAGPVFFKQVRTGKDGVDFTLIKFRSMARGNNVYDTSRDDEITRVGAIIRMLSVDELPQLINILRGEMSFIGPRPWIPEYFQSMSEGQKERYAARPGITGLAQARGRNSLTIDQKIKYDIHYVNNVTIARDMVIILLTIISLFEKDTLHIGKEGIAVELETLKRQKGGQYNLNKRTQISR